MLTLITDADMLTQIDAPSDLEQPISDELFGTLIELGYWPQDLMTLRQKDAILLLAA